MDGICGRVRVEDGFPEALSQAAARGETNGACEIPSNKEGKVICEIDGWVLWGMQIGGAGALLFWCAGDVALD